MPYPSLAAVLAMGIALLFYRGGAIEAHSEGANPGPLWALLSILVSALVLMGLDGGVFLLIIAQVVLFLGIGGYRAWAERPRD